MAPGEGGIRSPMIIVGPGVKGQRQVDAFTYVTDIMPTVLEMANLEHPKEYGGRKIAPMRGRSITKLLSGDVDEIYGSDEPVAGEMGGGQWVRLGDYKAVKSPRPFGQGEWHLYDLSKDPGETDNLSDRMPKKMEELMAAWAKYVDEVGVVEIEGDMSR